MPVYAVDTRFQVDLGAYISTGDYGSDKVTDIVYFPVSVRAQFDRAFVKASSGWVGIDGPGNIDTQTNANVSRHAQGLADTYLASGYSWYSRSWLPIDWLTAELKLKFPTADASRGLGTGEMDYFVTTSAYRAIGKIGLYGSLIYRWRERPVNTVLLNTAGASFVGIYNINKSLSVGANVEAHEASTPTSDLRGEVTPYISMRWSSGLSLMFYSQIGVTDGSPDFASGMQTGYKF